MAARSLRREAEAEEAAMNQKLTGLTPYETTVVVLLKRINTWLAAIGIMLIVPIVLFAVGYLFGSGS